MKRLVTLRPQGRLLACLAIAAGPLAAGPAAAQVAGFASLPSFAWPTIAEDAGGRWDGAFARLSTGFEVGSSKRFGSYAGPTFGFEGGRMWQEGRFVYGVVGGFDYLAAGGRSPGFGGLGYSRDFAGALQVKVGALVTPDVLVYAKAGAVAAHETWRFGPSAAGLGFDRDAVAVRPDARLGVEWRVNDRVTLTVEGGVGGTPFYR